MIWSRRIGKELFHSLGVKSRSLVLLTKHLIKRVGVALYHLDVDDGLLIFGGMIDETSVFQNAELLSIVR